MTSNAWAFLSHTFLTLAAQNHRPRLAISPGDVLVGWTTLSAPSRAFVVERAGSSWTGTSASPAGAARQQFLIGVTANAETGTAMILSFGSRLYATQGPGVLSIHPIRPMTSPGLRSNQRP